MVLAFIAGWNEIEKQAHENSCTKGFWDLTNPNVPYGEKIALMHSELSEALEATRAGNPPSEKCVGFSQLEEELADVLIRIADFSRACNLNLSQAVLAKMAYNLSRPFKHGKTF